MLSLWADLRAYWLRKPEYSILILGLDGAGKTTLLERVKQQLGQRHEPLDRVVPTVGQNGTSPLYLAILRQDAPAENIIETRY